MPRNKPDEGRKITYRFRLQARDIELLEAIARHRFLRSTHLDLLFPRTSPEGIRRRMRLLVRHGYASLIRTKRENKKWGGQAPLVYGIKAKARKLLKNTESYSPTRLAWLARSNDKNPSIEHQLMISDFLVAVAAEAAMSDTVTFIPPWKFAAFIGHHDRLDLSVSVTIDRRRISLRIVPDAICAIRLKRRDKEITRVLFFEAYRNRNVVLTSKNVRRKTIAKTLRGYEELHRQRKTQRYFPHRFTVVVSSNIDGRIESIRSVVSNEKLFRFFDSRELGGDVIATLMNQSPVSPSKRSD